MIRREFVTFLGTVERFLGSRGQGGDFYHSNCILGGQQMSEWKPPRRSGRDLFLGICRDCFDRRFESGQFRMNDIPDHLVGDGVVFMSQHVVYSCNAAPFDLRLCRLKFFRKSSRGF